MCLFPTTIEIDLWIKQNAEKKFCKSLWGSCFFNIYSHCEHFPMVIQIFFHIYLHQLYLFIFMYCFFREWPTPELWLPLSSPEFSITWAWMSTLKSWSFCWGNSRTQPVVTSTTQPLYKLWIKVRPNPGKARGSSCNELPCHCCQSVSLIMSVSVWVSLVLVQPCAIVTKLSWNFVHSIYITPMWSVIYIFCIDKLPQMKELSQSLSYITKKKS